MNHEKELKQAWARFVSESVSLSKTFLARFEKTAILFSSFCDLMLNICSAISSSSEYSCARHSSTMHLIIFFFGAMSIDSDCSKISTHRNQSNNLTSHSSVHWFVRKANDSLWWSKRVARPIRNVLNLNNCFCALSIKSDMIVSLYLRVSW